MSKRIAIEIILSEKINNILNRLTKKQNCPQCIVKRANIILMSSQGKGNKTIARELSIDRNTARHWRNKWADVAQKLTEAELNQDITDKDLTALIIDILKDDPRPGTPPTFTPENIAQIIAIACEDPKDSYREISNWTTKEIAQEAIKRNIVSTISERSVGRFLKSGGFKTSSF